MSTFSKVPEYNKHHRKIQDCDSNFHYIRIHYNVEIFLKVRNKVIDYMKGLGYKISEFSVYLCGMNGENYLRVFITENNVDLETVLEWMEEINRNANIISDEYDDHVEIILPF